MAESFRDDRAWHYDVPDDDAPLSEKLRHQRRLRAAWEAAEIPSHVLWIPREDPSRWWTHPTGLPPEVIQQRIQKQMRRYVKGE